MEGMLENLTGGGLMALEIQTWGGGGVGGL